MNKDQQAAKNREYQRRYRERRGQEWKDYHAAWVASHPEQMKEYGRSYYVRHRDHLLLKHKRTKEWCLSIAALNGGRVCLACGEGDPVVLEFHHRAPKDKLFGIATLRDIPKPEDAAMVMAEIAKCDVLCANCHRRAHANGLR